MDATDDRATLGVGHQFRNSVAVKSSTVVIGATGSDRCQEIPENTRVRRMQTCHRNPTGLHAAVFLTTMSGGAVFDIAAFRLRRLITPLSFLRAFTT